MLQINTLHTYMHGRHTQEAHNTNKLLALLFVDSPEVVMLVVTYGTTVQKLGNVAKLATC